MAGKNSANYKSACDFYAKNKWLTDKGGRITSDSEISQLPPEIREKISKWYLTILSEIPLANANAGIPNDHGLDEFKSTPLEKCPSMWVRFLTLQEIKQNIQEYMPDLFLWKHGYFPFAHYDTVGTNLMLKCGHENPPILLIFPPFVENIKHLIGKSETILPQFSDMFRLMRKISF